MCYNYYLPSGSYSQERATLQSDKEPRTNTGWWPRPTHARLVAVLVTFAGLLLLLVGLESGGLFSARSSPPSAKAASASVLQSRPSLPVSAPAAPAARRVQATPEDPVAPRQTPPSLALSSRFFTETGHLVAGVFLDYYNANPKAADLFGLPLTEAFSERFPGGQSYLVQYFERARLEYHPEMPAGQQVGLGLVGSEMAGGRTWERLPSLPSLKTRLYFPETGHTISNGFLTFWKANGGLTSFGFPISEETGENGLTVQYFERARFEYYKNLEGTGYAVQLSPAGYYALKASGLNIPMGTLVRFQPPRAAEGHTAVVQVAISAGVTVTGSYEGRPLLFKHEPEKGVAWALIGSVPFQDLGKRAVTISLQNGDGGNRTVTRNLEVVRYPFPSESLQFDPETAKLLDPAITDKERALLDGIFAGRTPEQYWTGTFRMPLDGKIRITSAFATRRCYNCPIGSTPTSYHGGMDMAAAVGTRVHAPAAGKVVFAGQLSDRGNAIVIDHGMGVFSLFAHNSKLLATVGQTVQQGDVISLSGNTGLSNGPHLHWEVHVSGPPVEPLEWVNRTLP